MPLSILPIAIPLVYGTEGAIADVSTFKGEKSILLSGSFQGQYILLGSHDDINFKPLFAFSGTGVLSIKQILNESIRSVRFRSLATNPIGMTASISGESVAGSNDFVTLPIVLPGGYGQQPIVDLFTLAPPSGLLRGTNIILSGNFMGMVTVDGSLDGIRFSPIGTFRNLSLPGLNDGLQPTVPEHEPLVYTEQVRYVRINVMTGTFVSTPITITIGGEVAVSVGSDSYLSEPMTNASGAPMLRGEVVRISGNDSFTRSQADVPANIRGLVGVMLDVAAVGAIQEVVTEGKCFVLLEPALVPVAGDPIWVSGTIAGRATNVLPALDAGLGIIKDASMYAATGGVVADVDPAGTAAVLAAFTLAATYTHGANAADQTMTLNDANGGGITILGHGSAVGNVALTVDGGTYVDAAGTRNHTLTTAIFNPPGGNANFNLSNLTYTVNQVGGANGTVTGIYLRATETAVVGTHNLMDLGVGAVSRFVVGRYGNTTIAQAAIATVTAGSGFTLTGGAHTAQPNAEIIDANFNLARTVTFVGGGATTIALQRAIVFQAPTYDAAVAGLTLTTAATVAITGEPIDAGANIALPDALALWVQAGGTRLASGLALGTTAVLAPAEPDIAFGSGATIVSALNTGRIGYELAGQRFMVSTNNTAYVPLLTGPAPAGFTARYVPFGNATGGTLTEDSYFQFNTIYHTLLLGSAADETLGRSSLAILASGAINQVLASEWNGLHVQGGTLGLSSALGPGTSPVTAMSLVKFDASSITSANAIVVTTASTCTITGPIAAGGLVTITTPLSLWVQSGNTTLQGAILTLGTAGVGSSATITTPANMLTLEQTGDALGDASLSLQNRTGLCGFIVTTTGAPDLVDIGLKPSIGAQYNFRWNHLAALLVNATNTNGEFQLLPASAGVVADKWVYFGESISGLQKGSFLIGVASTVTGAYGVAKLQVYKATNGTMNVYRDSADAGGPTIEFIKTRSSTYGLVVNGDALGSFGFAGGLGTGAVGLACQIRGEVDGVASATSLPGRFVFLVSPANTITSLTEVARITSNANLLIGTVADVATSRFQVQADKTVTAVAGVGATVWHGLNYKASTLSLTMGGAAVAVDALSAAYFAAPVLTANTGAGIPTVATMSTVTIGGPPTVLAGSSTPVITNPLSLWVQSGKVLLGTVMCPIGFGTFDRVFGITSAVGVSGIIFGQSDANNCQYYWVYNAVPANAYAGFATNSYANPLKLDASYIGIQTLAAGNVLIGTTVDVAASKLQVQADKTIASAAGAVYDGVNVKPSTVSITGNTAITTATGFNLFNIAVPIYVGDTATCVIDYAATVRIAGAPDDADAEVTITNPYALWLDAGAFRCDGRELLSRGANVAAATDIALGEDGNSFGITVGTGVLDRIATARWQAGSVVILHFAAVVTVSDGTAASATHAGLQLAGSVPLVTAADTMLTLYFDGTWWQEIARKAA